MKILIVQDMGIGDAVLLTAVLPLIKKEHEVHLLTPYATLLAGNPYIKKFLSPLPSHLLPSGYDLYVNLWNSDKYRFPKNTLPPRNFKNFTLHEIERYQLVMKPLLEKTTRAVRPMLYVKTGEKVKKRVGLMINAKLHSKTWTDENYQRLTDYLKQNYEVLPFGQDTSKDLSEVAYDISRCEYFIGNDTGLSHMAAALQVPLLTMYFNKVQNPLRWTPWGTRQLLVRSRTNCPDKCLSSECAHPVCREELPFEEVKATFDALARGEGFSTRTGSLYPLAKRSLFVLLFGGDRHRKGLEDIPHAILPKNASLPSIVRTIKEKNINLIHTYVKPGMKLKLAALIGSNFVPEYPIIIEDKGKALENPNELLDFYFKEIERTTGEDLINKA
jgi:ADP-heptose:LPS heptosyltransferase